MPILVLAAAGMAPAFARAAGVLEQVESFFVQAVDLINTGYQTAPVLALVLSALLILPLVALVSFAVQRAARSKARHAAMRAAQRRAKAGDGWAEDGPAGAAIPVLQSQAWLTIEGKRLGTMPLAGQTIRIGRHEENDVRLTDSSVHRYHAIIERTAEEAFVITDLSGKDGNGIRINGERTARAKLTDGDLIELGRAKLKFETAPI